MTKSRIIRRKKMKKVFAILLVICMFAALAACSGSDDDSGTASAPPASTAPSADNSGGGDNNAAPPADNANPNVASSPPSIEDLPVVDADFEIPYVDFGYKPTSDPFARDKYQFAHIVMMHAPYTQLMVDMYALMGERLNYEINSYSSYRDFDLFLNLIETNAAQGVDAMVIEGDFTTQDGIFSVTDEYDITFMPGLSPFINIETGKYLRPSAVMDSYNQGWVCMDYMLDNYERYTGQQFDPAKIGFMTIEFGIISDFNTRRDGAVAAYTARYGDYLATNYFNLDTSAEANPMAAEPGYNYAANTVSAHPEFEGWLVYGTAEDFADRASRALEDMGYGGTSLVTCTAAEMLIERWKTGYEGCWVAGAETPAVQWSHAIISGLMQLLEGTATPETLWPEYRQPGQDYTVIFLPFTMIERDMYEDFEAAVARYTASIFVD